MPTHAEAMRERLPLLYRDGELVGGVLAQPGVQIEVLDEEALAVQRAHWFGSALSLDDAAGLAALLDFAPEPWHDLRTFRAWVNAIRDALVEEGAATVAAVQRFVARFAADFEQARAVRAVGVSEQTAWVEEPADDAPALDEGPLRRAALRAPSAGGIEPLHRFTVANRGLDETHAAFLLTGRAGGPESVPVIANLTTGAALAYLGDVGPGRRLWIRAEPDGSATARLEGEDVTGRLRTISPLEPGAAWTAADAATPASALRLARGANSLWFLPVAHFDERGLDRVLLALAELSLRQGSWDESAFDRALFHQDPAILLDVTWVEAQPAAFDVVLPAGVMRSRVGRLARALEDRERLGTSLEAGVDQVRAAGVDGRVVLAPFTEVQGQGDLLGPVLPMTFREAGPTGADGRPDAGGLWGVTDFDDSTFR